MPLGLTQMTAMSILETLSAASQAISRALRWNRITWNLAANGGRRPPHQQQTKPQLRSTCSDSFQKFSILTLIGWKQITRKMVFKCNLYSITKHTLLWNLDNGYSSKLPIIKSDLENVVGPGIF